MDLDVTADLLDLVTHLVVLEEELLRLPRLVIELGCELMILQDGQTGCRL